MHVLMRVAVLYLGYFFIRTFATVQPARENCLTPQYGSNKYTQKGCECVVFQSLGRLQRKFTSPNYPAFYPRNIPCILYTFIGDIGEIVELTFLQFDMKMGTTAGCTDYLRVFLNLDRPVVDQYTGWNYDMCGNITSINKRHYSSGRSIVLELHSDQHPGNFTGFMGTFRFLDERRFKSDCTKEDGTKCTYICRSSNISTSGKFFSPGYPQNYPPRSSCKYVFQGRPGEKVKIVFQNIQLHHKVKDGSCLDNPDMITVHDGIDRTGPVIGRYCGVQNQIERISSKHYLFVNFYANELNERQGFAATYTFCRNCFKNPTRANPTTIVYNKGIRGITSSPFITHNPDHTYNCDKHFISSDKKNGSFESLNYPKAYPQGVTCKYTFQGEGRERVQINFTHLDLYYPSGNADDPHQCDGSDSINVYAMINGDTLRLERYCGKKLPQMIMSNEPKLTVVFSSIHSSSLATGFKANFSFVQNFGITTGKQDSKYVCGFNYFSSTAHTGVIMSPNYPGFYPRNTECHYLFYGQKYERVSITFTFFDVDGMAPRCQEDTLSDYLEFSNFNTPDRKMRRYCGSDVKRLPKRTVQSDMEFFRIMFKSNEVYDGKGFYAEYEFKRDPSHVDYLSNPSNGNGNNHGPYTYRHPNGKGQGHQGSWSVITVCLIIVCTNQLLCISQLRQVNRRQHFVRKSETVL